MKQVKCASLYKSCSFPSCQVHLISPFPSSCKSYTFPSRQVQQAFPYRICIILSVVVLKGLLTFLGFFLCNAEFSPCWALPEYIRALIHWACLRVFPVTLWVIVYWFHCVKWQGQSDWFFKITLDPLRIMEYRVSKVSTVSIITAFTRHQLWIDIFFSLPFMKDDIKIQNAAIWRFLRQNPTL